MFCAAEIHGEARAVQPTPQLQFPIAPLLSSRGQQQDCGREWLDRGFRHNSIKDNACFDARVCLDAEDCGHSSERMTG